MHLKEKQVFSVLSWQKSIHFPDHLINKNVYHAWVCWFFLWLWLKPPKHSGKTQRDSNFLLLIGHTSVHMCTAHNHSALGNWGELQTDSQLHTMALCCSIDQLISTSTDRSHLIGWSFAHLPDQAESATLNNFVLLFPEHKWVGSRCYINMHST